MGFFDFITNNKKVNKNTPIPSDKKNNVKISITTPSSKTISNEEYLAKRERDAQKIESLYDLNSVSGIRAIPVPAPRIDGESISSNIEYYLRLKASSFRDSGRMDLAIECLRKSNELMPYSSLSYRKDDYMRLVQYLKYDNQFDEARKVETELRKKFPELFDDGAILAKQNFEDTLKLCREFRTDLVEMTSHSATCGECAKYEGRIYSISGKDKRFPALPDFIRKTGIVHPGCRHTFSPYQFSSPMVNGQDPITFSNRPFIDERTAEDKINYQKFLDQQAAKRRRELDRTEFDLIRENFPDLAPKSFNAYRKMKQTGSESFQELKKAMKEIGIDL